MANNSNLTLALKIKALVEGLKEIEAMTGEVKDLGAAAAKPIPDPTPEIRKGVNKTGDAINELGKSIAGLVTIGAIKQFVSYSVDQFAQAESAFRGLEAVANHSGVGIGRAMQEAEKLAADGLITVADASKALQNLLARGYSADQAVQTLTRLKDAAAFNRAAHLSMGEAIVSASEGLKNENSILVDNAGVTKNVSVLWKEYAASIGKSVTDLTQQEKIQAEVNGIMRETEAQAGNAAKAMDGYQGQMAKADSEQRKFAASMGQLLAPALIGLRQGGTWLIDNFFKPLVFFLQSSGIAVGHLAQNFGAFFDLLKNRDLTAFNEQIARNREIADQMRTELAGNLAGGNLDFQPLGDGAKKAAAATTEATADIGKALKQQAADRKASVKEQIADAERLRTALIKAFDDSLKAEKSYRDQANKLRAEASAAPKDSSAAGQASAAFDLIAAEQKLQRIKGSAPLSDVQAQAELVQKLASGLDDQARAQEAVNRAKLAEADALDRAAAGEQAQQAGLTEQQRLNEARLTQMQALLKDLEAGKTVTLDADTAKADTALEKTKATLDSITDKTVTLTVNQVGSAAGAIPGHRTGTVLPGYGGGDRRLILAEDGEAITRKEAVAYYGRSFMAALNARQIPRFANGGIVSGIAASVPASGSGLHPVTLNFPGVGSWPMSASADVVGELNAALAREALKHGRR